MLRSILITLMLSLTAPPASAETVHALDQVPAHLKTPEARDHFDRQINGKPTADAFGVRLPDDLTPDIIVPLVVPAAADEQRSLVGFKRWSGRPDGAVVIVCTGGAGRAMSPDNRCAQADTPAKPALKVYLGVLEARDGSLPRAVAVSGPITGALKWDKPGLPAAPAALDEAVGGVIRPDHFDGLDLAPYLIAPGVTAVGLRAGWTESYSGGGAEFGALYLFAVDGRRLRQVLAVPMTAFSDTAGDWHKNGTRDHTIVDGANILVHLPTMTDGHYDLAVRSRTSAWRRVFRWSADAGAYQPAD